jgi:hypothetical protein
MEGNERKWKKMETYKTDRGPEGTVYGGPNCPVEKTHHEKS